MTFTIRIRIIIILVSSLISIAGSFQSSPPGNTRYERYEVISSRIVRPGVTYSLIGDKRGPWRAYVLEIDLRQTELDIQAARAMDKLFGREQTSSIAKRHETSDRSVIAALNADFFSLATGENENNNIVDGDYVKGTKMTGSPFDTFDNIHSQFGMSFNRKPLLDRFAFVGKVVSSQGITTDLFGVNDMPVSNSVVLFSSYFGPITPTDTIKMSINELLLRQTKKENDTLFAIVTAKSTTGASPLSAGTFVLSGYDLQNSIGFSSAKVGDTLKIWLGTSPNRGSMKTLVGGWPRIVLDGRNIGALADSIEGTFPRFSAQRNPRTGVGLSVDSTTVYFLAVDGRQQSSAGMTLVEFADFMISQGIYQGLNLDGGGSTTFVVEGKIMNSPSDATGERPVGNCLLLTAPKTK